MSTQHLEQASPRSFSIEILCSDSFGVAGSAHFTGSPAGPGRQNQPKKLCRKRAPNPEAIFFHYFGAVLPAHPVSHVLSGLSLIQALQPPNLPDLPPSCSYFDCHLNPVSYFYNLLGAFALFSSNGKATGGGTRNICWVGLHSLSPHCFTRWG